MTKDEQDALNEALKSADDQLWLIRRELPNCLYLLGFVRDYVRRGRDAPEWFREAMERALREKGA